MKIHFYALFCVILILKPGEKTWLYQTCYDTAAESFSGCFKTKNKTFIYRSQEKKYKMAHG